MRVLTSAVAAMQDLFTSLADVLGKRIDDPAVVNFLDVLGETPDIEDRGEECLYFFPAHGFSFWYDPAVGYIWVIHIVILHAT